jgi:hypothetical protein
MALRLGTNEICHKDRVTEFIALIAYLSRETNFTSMRASFCRGLTLTATPSPNGGWVPNKTTLLVHHLRSREALTIRHSERPILRRHAHIPPETRRHLRNREPGPATLASLSLHNTGPSHYAYKGARHSSYTEYGIRICAASEGSDRSRSGTRGLCEKRPAQRAAAP